jgi:hypothetical protein
MFRNILITFFLLFQINYVSSQVISGKYIEKNFATYEEDFSILYKKCQDSRLDSINKICIVFMNDYGIRKDEKKLNYFCKRFLKNCHNDNNDGLTRRILTIELVNKSKLSYVDATKLNTSFKKLFIKFFNENDNSAALECLFEQAMINNKRNETLETIKILFFCENFAKRYHLQKDLCYQRILHELGYKLLYLKQNRLAIDYFKKSLLTKHSSTMDSLISLNGIGMAYQELKYFNESNKYLKKASVSALKAKNYLFNNVINGNIALNKFRLGKLDESFHYAYLEKNTSFKNELWSNGISSMCLLVQIELKKENVTHAKVLIDSINNLIYKTKSDDYILRKKQYEAIYLYNLKINNDQKALSAYQNFNYFEKLFQNISNKDKISIIEIRAKSDVYNLEMVKIEERKKTKDLLVTILLVLLSLFSLCVIYYFRKKVKLVEKTKSEISAINVIQAKEIDYLKKALLNQLDIIKNDNSNFLNKQEDIKALKEFNLSQKEQWESFKNLFLSTYPTFQSILDLKLGKTSSGELRLIMLHKLGLNNKEISQALFISIDGVKKANYRLYKKMNIKTSQELINFFD